MKKLKNLKGAVALNKAQQKEVDGGMRPTPVLACNGNCAGRPSGSLCFYQGHCDCEGRCSSGTCIPL